MLRTLRGTTPYRKKDAALYAKRGWWRGLTLGEWLDRAADIHPDKTAFVDMRSRLSYAEARERAERLAVAFRRIGLKPLDRVLIQMPNWSEFVPAYFALHKIGAVPVMLIDRYRQHEIERLADLSGASAWIVPVRHRKVDYLPIIDDVLRSCPRIRNVMTVRGEREASGFSSLDRLLEETEPTQAELERLPRLRPHPDQVAHMGPTGGTTGTPKIVPRTHNSLSCATEFCSLSWGQHSEDVSLIVGSIGHDLSLSKGLLGSVITLGTLVLLDTTDAQSICETIEREKVTSVVWVPTLAQRLLEYEDLDKYDLSSLEKMHCGGAVSPPALVRDVFERLGVRFCNSYGATEGMATVTRAADDVNTVASSVGRPSCPGDTYKVIDRRGVTLLPGESGELLVKGPGVFTGYYMNEEENARAFDKDGFFRTGDVAEISEKGYLTITGRIKEMINRGGESISATVIERLVERHPDVAAVAVVSMPDPLMGERVCAYIQPRAGCEPTFETVITFLREEKASVLALPERIEFVDTMPYTGAHKFDKNALRDDIRRKLAAEAEADGARGARSGSTKPG